MAKWYKIILISAIIIVIVLAVKTFLPYLKLVGQNYNNNKEGIKGSSSEDVRGTNIGNTYISNEVKEYNKTIKHSEDSGFEVHIGDVGGEVYKTPIYGGAEVAKHFKDSSSYYKGEIKLEEAIYNYIPALQRDTAGMNNSALAGYFEGNVGVIESKLGITDAKAFVRLIGSLDRLNERKFTSVDILANTITENSSNMSINFLIQFKLEDGTSIAPVSINISHLKSTGNQSAPYVQFTGVFKSQRSE